MTSLGTPIQGVTLYSFTRAFHGREYDLEGLIRKDGRRRASAPGWRSSASRASAASRTDR